MPESFAPSDGELLRLVLEGSEDAFTQLYRRHHGSVYRFALQMSGSPEVADEVVQEVFLALMGGLAGFDGSRGPLSAYLLGMARNFVRRSLQRDQAYSVAIDEPASGADELTDGGDVLRDLTRSEQIEAVRQAVLSLPANYREVVVLCDLEEIQYAEAALTMNCAIGTVRSRLHRARALLMDKLRTKDRCTA